MARAEKTMTVVDLFDPFRHSTRGGALLLGSFAIHFKYSSLFYDIQYYAGHTSFMARLWRRARSATTSPPLDRYGSNTRVSNLFTK